MLKVVKYVILVPPDFKKLISKKYVHDFLISLNRDTTLVIEGRLAGYERAQAEFGTAPHINSLFSLTMLALTFGFKL
jgi:hypothetical protein